MAKDTKSEAKKPKRTKRADNKRPSLLQRRKSSGKQPSDRTTITNNPVSRYFKGAWYELRHVTWPDRAETTRLTIGVVVYSLFFALFIALIDYLFDIGFERFII